MKTLQRALSGLAKAPPDYIRQVFDRPAEELVSVAPKEVGEGRYRSTVERFDCSLTNVEGDSSIEEWKSQIRLGSRTPEWRALLGARIANLSSRGGQAQLSYHVSWDDWHGHFRVEPESGVLTHWESYRDGNAANWLGPGG